MRKNQKPNILL